MSEKHTNQHDGQATQEQAFSQAVLELEKQEKTADERIARAQQEKDRIIAQSKQEAQQIIEKTRLQAIEEKNKTVQAAEAANLSKAKVIIEDAEKQAAAIKQEATKRIPHCTEVIYRTLVD